MTLKELTKKIEIDWNIVRPESLSRELQNLLSYYLKLSWSELQLQKDRSITANEEAEIQKALVQLKAGMPLAYITGEQFFFKSSFYVNPDVLIPRPETEILVELALNEIDSGKAIVTDLGAGSGCIGLSIAKENPNCQVWLVDSEDKALQVAATNGKRLNLNNISLQKGQVGSESFALPNLVGSVDLIVANPPYIADGDSRVDWRVHQFEPHSALYAPNNGLKWIHKWLEWGYDYLKPNGTFIFEFGKDQDEDIKLFLKNTFYKEIEFVKDYSSVVRFCKLKK